MVIFFYSFLLTPQLLETNVRVNAYIEMAVSFDNRFLALFADTGLLWIGSSDLQVGGLVSGTTSWGGGE